MRSYPLLSIGPVTLTTGKNKMFGLVWDCWEKNDKSFNYLLSFPDGRMMVAHSSGAISVMKIDSVHYFIADQSGRPYGSATVIGIYPHNEEGMKQLATQSNKKSLVFATFK